MKTFKQFIAESDAPANVTGPAIANPDAKPLFKETIVAGKPCLEMDQDTYNKCLGGKVPFERWSNYIEDEELRTQVRSLWNKHKSIMIMNSSTGLYTEFK